ncbi:MAG: DUF1624 domain-containing protein [Ignavibacteria bacterium]|nr:DUF1624 domain-containing protein [Ignavibacteria bacterium]
MNAGNSRIHFIDLLRGVAVVAMVFGHTFDAVLEVESRSTAWFQLYTFLRGFTAPVFLFVSGLAFAVATEKRWSSFTRWSPHLRRRLLRVLLLLVIGYALHLPFYSLGKTLAETNERELRIFLQTDVLQCIAATLLLLHLLILVLRDTTMFVRSTAALALMMTVATPYVWSVDLSSTVSPVIAPYLNGLTTSPFPLFPYAAFLLAGIVTGHYFGKAREFGEADLFALRLAGASAAIAVSAILIDIALPSFVTNPVVWHTSPVITMLKLAGVLQLILLFVRIPAGRGRFVMRLELLGQTSFFVYAFHIALVYGSALNEGLSGTIGRTLNPGWAVAAAAGMVVCMDLIVQGWYAVSERYATATRYGRIALASGLIYLFIIRPY